MRVSNDFFPRSFEGHHSFNNETQLDQNIISNIFSSYGSAYENKSRQMGLKPKFLEPIQHLTGCILSRSCS